MSGSILPSVSLDNIRDELKIKYNDDQGKVSQIAKEKIKEYLRTKTNFVFNATNLRAHLRIKYLNLFKDYNFRGFYDWNSFKL